MTDFSSISDAYKEKSLVQAPAGKQLLDLLAIPADADILDVGCGSGNITLELRRSTTGRVVGIDPSAGMIREASDFCKGNEIEFQVIPDSEMSFAEEFDIIFCNSAFQWFTDPLATLGRFHAALRHSGKAGIQAPARTRYSPNFVESMEYACALADISRVYKHFRSPWFFLDSTAEYRALFERAGFTIVYCDIETVHQPMTPAQVFDAFNSGAAAGYLNQHYFSTELPDGFADRVLERVKDSFEHQADATGLVDLVFYRIYAVLSKKG